MPIFRGGSEDCLCLNLFRLLKYSSLFQIFCSAPSRMAQVITRITSLCEQIQITSATPKHRSCDLPISSAQPYTHLHPNSQKNTSGILSHPSSQKEVELLSQGQHSSIILKNLLHWSQVSTNRTTDKIFKQSKFQANLFDVSSALIAMPLKNGPSNVSVIFIHLTSMCFNEHWPKTNHNKNRQKPIIRTMTGCGVTAKFYFYCFNIIQVFIYFL